MLFTDYLFFPFLFVCFLCYFILPIKTRWISLLLFSLFFFASWGIDYLPLVLIVTFVAWIGGRIMDRRNHSAEVDSFSSNLLSIEKEDELRTSKPDKYQKGSISNENGQGESRKHGEKRITRNILIISSFLILAVLVYVKSQRLLTKTFMEPLVHWCSTVHSSIISFLKDIPFVRDFVSTGRGLDVAVLEWIFGNSSTPTAFGETGVSSLNSLAMDSASKSVLYTWIVPVGISYYILSLIGYLADVYWNKERAEKNYFKLLLFVLYFPKLLEGPISKHRTLAPQLLEGHRFDYRRFSFGSQRVIWGLFKKLVIADQLSLLVNAIFGNYEIHYGSEFLFAAVFGSVQLYCDFSGCMDIALGVSECIGIKLEENFAQPFCSSSVAEFWRRWHISLGIWFKDYIYMPLVISPKLTRLSGFLRKRIGKRVGRVFLSGVPLGAVWLLTGLWHGTSGNYLVWGAYWGLLIILSTVFEPEFRKLMKLAHVDSSSEGFKIFQKCKVFCLFVVSRIISIPSNLGISWHAAKSVFTNFGPWKLVDGSLFTFGIDRRHFTVVMLAIVLVGFVGSKQNKGVHIRERIAAMPLPIRWAIYYGLIITLLIFGAYGPGYDVASFVYMRY